jgi:hypothetical protein
MILPDKTTNFNDFIASLLVDFNTLDAIPYPVREENWQQVCDAVANSPTFIRLAVPTTRDFPNWVEWGKMMYSTAAR